jgi:hypothetical protein
MYSQVKSERPMMTLLHSNKMSLRELVKGERELKRSAGSVIRLGVKVLQIVTDVCLHVSVVGEGNAEGGIADILDSHVHISKTAEYFNFVFEIRL